MSEIIKKEIEISDEELDFISCKLDIFLKDTDIESYKFTGLQYKRRLYDYKTLKTSENKIPYFDFDFHYKNALCFRGIPVGLNEQLLIDCCYEPNEFNKLKTKLKDELCDLLKNLDKGDIK